VGKNKLFKFADLVNKPNVFQKGSNIKGKWQSDFFKNNYPVVLELACGKGDYSIGMAVQFPEKNFIGMDIKGNRIWSAATITEKLELNNIAFIRDQIDKIEDYFLPETISEIWITFSDPFPKKNDHRKRLTSLKFLPLYKKVLEKDGIIHLKTDSDLLYEYTKEVLAEVPSEVLKDYPDVYAMDKNSELYNIQTYYEKMHLKNGRTIKYLCFRLF